LNNASSRLCGKVFFEIAQRVSKAVSRKDAKALRNQSLSNLMKLFVHKFIAVFTVAVCAVNLSAQTLSGARMVPITEGWAKNQINAVIFRKNSVTSFRKNQYVAFYDEDSKVVVAKRRLGTLLWQIRRTQFSGNTADAHNSISLTVDGNGFLHLAWNHHGVPLQYSRSRAPESLEFSDQAAMTGDTENKVTYPEFYNLPDGNLLFFYRDGASGNGSLILDLYDIRTKKWSRLQNNLIDGEGQRNAYPQTAVDAKGTIHLSWVWRESPNVATNHDLCYARSTDGGKTWQKSTGEKYALPITADTAEYVWRIPQNSELINQTSMAADNAGNPLIATYWRPAGTEVPQYELVYFDGLKWNRSQISNRTTPFSLSGQGTKKIPIARPQIVVDANKIVVIFRDIERGDRVSAAICTNLKKAIWKIKDLTETGVGMWEPTLDRDLWNKKKVLNLFVQKVGQGDGEGLEELPPQMISILEWKP
jgi:hypothetical protein